MCPTSTTFLFPTVFPSFPVTSLFFPRNKDCTCAGRTRGVLVFEPWFYLFLFFGPRIQSRPSLPLPRPTLDLFPFSGPDVSTDTSLYFPLLDQMTTLIIEECIPLFSITQVPPPLSLPSFHVVLLIAADGDFPPPRAPIRPSPFLFFSRILGILLSVLSDPSPSSSITLLIDPLCVVTPPYVFSFPP